MPTQRDELRAVPRFQPIPKRKQKPQVLHIMTAWEPDEYEKLKRLAEQSGTSMKDFVKQSVRFACDNMEGAD